MLTIQERANNWAERRLIPKSQLAHAVICYINGANEQREIDIDKAYSVICDYLISTWNEKMIPNKEWFSKAMKGE